VCTRIACRLISHDFLGSVCLAEELKELRKREAEQDIEADWEVDAFMTADTVGGKREAIVSEYILRILGLDVSLCNPSLPCT